MMCAKKFLFTIPVFIFNSLAFSAIKLPALISNNMVLQQKSKVALWGWADAGEKVFITTSWNNRTTDVTAAANGKWITYVKTDAAGGPYTIRFKASNDITVN